jgi:CheY-like chemotaxis protein
VDSVEIRSILYVEDNRFDIELTMESIKEGRIRNPLVVSHDGIEALEYLNGTGIHEGRAPGNPCLILLDLKMPRMDGLEFLAIVKKDARFRTIPIVMLTSSREEKDLVRSYDLGVNAYIVKPVDFESFSSAVREIAMFWALLNELPQEGTVQDGP